MNERCTKCGGDGIYKWGEILNGVATRQGTCWRCNGSGVEPIFHWDPVPEKPACVMICPDGSEFDLTVLESGVENIAINGGKQSIHELADVLKGFILQPRRDFPYAPNVYAAMLSMVRHYYSVRFPA